METENTPITTPTGSTNHFIFESDARLAHRHRLATVRVMGAYVHSNISADIETVVADAVALTRSHSSHVVARFTKTTPRRHCLRPGRLASETHALPLFLPTGGADRHGVLTSARIAREER